MTTNEAIKIYIEESKKAAEAKKLADNAKKFLLSIAGDNDRITTDEFIVYVNRTFQDVLDTKALYKDFPDIKETYGKLSPRVSLDPHTIETEKEKAI